MTDEGELQNDVNRATRAQALLTDPLFVEAFDSVREAYMATWAETGLTDEKGREKLFLSMRVVADVKKAVERIMMNGSIARKQLANLEEDKARAQRKS